MSINPAWTRRELISTLATIPVCAISSGLFSPANCRSEASSPSFQTHKWIRDLRNPILKPQESYDVRRCMNPFVVQHDDQYYLFYSGADQKGTQRICLAIAARDDLIHWKRIGPLFDVGPPGNFAEKWCVLPCVHRINNQWHLYYTGRENSELGLQSFPGIGLATSDDLIHWKKSGEEPVLGGDGFDLWPDNRGVAGGGKIVELPQEDGKILYRMHYTLATGKPDKNLLIDQAKHSVAADSWDGLHWFNKQVMLSPRLKAPYENAATIALNAWKTDSGWRAIYAGIGTQFGAYSICEAASHDGIHWERGQPGENLALAPAGSGWESQMTTYPHVIAEPNLLRLFYCGNGYGRTGIGTAVAERIT